ncbi:MAG: HK97 gp10 family phage protein [Cyanobacteria bacterium J149]|nr:MAG: HK97 gp10 family phage protein [Cyanobacteria bacterium J149]
MDYREDMSDFKVHVEGLDKLEKALQIAPKKTLIEMDKAVKSIVTLLEAEAKKATPVDRGTLRSKIESKVKGLKGTVKAKTDYAVFVHEGTRPHFPHIKAIEGWARQHGIEPFLVARAISRKGTKARPFFEIAFKKSKGNIQKVLSKLIDKVGELIV